MSGKFYLHYADITGHGSDKVYWDKEMKYYQTIMLKSGK